jgi:formyl-CoA transferase
MQESGSREGQPLRGPLTGIRVLDLGTVFAGPFAASLLADFGADVVKVELPKVGDPVRGIGPHVEGVSGPWTILNRNKRCVSLDIRKERGRELLKRLVARSNIVVENFRPGTLEKWDLGYEALKQINPMLILVRISGYGQTGPFSHKAGFGTPATAFSGLTYMQGYSDRPPVSPPFPLADYVTGTFGALAALAAYIHLKIHEGAGGQQIDIALYESVFRMLETVVAQYDLAGEARERVGHGLVEAVPAGAFECQDGKWVVLVTSTDRTFHRLAEVMGRTDMLTDPRFDTNQHRVQNRRETLAVVEEWFAGRTSAEALQVLDDAGVPVCPIHSMADIFQDPHYRARENLIEVEHPVLGKVTMPGIVPKFSDTPGSVRFAAPAAIGAHNREVYQDELGLSPEEVEELRRDEVI